MRSTLIDQLDLLREENLQLRQQLHIIVSKPTTAIRPEWRLRRKEARVFSALISGNILPMSMIKLAAYGTDDIEDGTIHTEIYRIRRKLAPFGMYIYSHYGIGFQLIGYKPETHRHEMDTADQ